MFDFRLLIKLIGRTFSIKKEGLRYPYPKRVIAVLLVFPFCTFLLIVNWIFLLLDELIFPHYRKVEIKKACFIIGIPRSATTYFLHLLSNDKKNYTSFKLWEILYAPSILQKYFYNGLNKSLCLLSISPVKLLSRFDKWVYGTFREIHEIGILKPEEDEILNIHIFKSVFLSYFFPGTDLLDDLYYFDENIPYNKRMKIFRFYYRCVQRHCFVFNQGGHKYFISKNSAFIPKLCTISEWFPQSKLIYLLRSPFNTIPSTISLNMRMYSAFTKQPTTYQLVTKTCDILIKWYEMAEYALNTFYKHRSIKIPFKEFTKNLYPTMQHVYSFLDVEITKEIRFYLEKEHSYSQKYSSSHKYDPLIGIDQDEITKKLDFIIKSDIFKKI